MVALTQSNYQTLYLNYLKNQKYTGCTGIEPMISVLKTDILPLN